MKQVTINLISFPEFWIIQENVIEERTHTSRGLCKVFVVGQININILNNLNFFKHININSIYIYKIYII